MRDDADNVFACFEAMAQRYPKRVAVREGDRFLTYEALLDRALVWAAQLDAEDARPVGIELPAGLDFVVAVLAALRQGRPFVPLGPSQPEILREEILRTTNPSVVVTADAVAGLNRATRGAPPVSPRAGPDSVASILFTSGSTGKPKGVYQSHAILLHDIRCYGEAIRLQPGDVLTWMYSPLTGGAIRDVFGALLHGAELVAMDPVALGSRGIGEAVAQRKITIFHAIPPLLREFLAAAPAPEWLRTVRLLYVAGDRFFKSDLDQVYRYFPRDSLVYTGLGATECTTLHHHWVLSAGTTVETDLVPVGFPVPGKQIRLVDERGLEVPAGETGEIEVSSAFIALGYWNDPARTREAFRPDPADPQRRIYRTGDWGRRLPDGNLLFTGRKDGVVKIRGHRVEIPAVEAALQRIPGIREEVVLPPDQTGSALTAVLVADDPLAGETEDARTRAVQAELARCLPDAARPLVIIWRESLPKLPSRKVDRLQLLRLIGEKKNLPEAVAHNPEDQALIELWRQATHPHAKADLDRTFTEAGGDSLGAMRLHTQLERRAGRLLSPGLIHARQTLRGLLADWPMVGRGRPESGRRPVWFVVGGISWSVPHTAEFAREAEGCFGLYTVSLMEAAAQGALDIPALGRQVAQVIRDWKGQQGDEMPLGLLGVSLGGLIAHEAACQLQEQGVKLAGLMAVDLGPGSPLLDSSWSYRWKKTWRRIRRGDRSINLGWVLRVLANRWLPSGWVGRLTRWGTRQEKGWANQAYDLMNRAVFLKIKRWRPRFYDGTLTLVKPVDGLGTDPQAPLDFGWGPHAVRVELREIPGSHLDLFTPGVREHMMAILRLNGDRSSATGGAVLDKRPNPCSVEI